MAFKKLLISTVRVFDKTVTNVANVGFYTASVLSLILVLMVFLEAILRYFRLAKISFADELSGYTNAAILFLSLATVLRMGRHIRVTLLVDHLPKKLQNVLSQLQPVILMLWLTVIFFPVWNLFVTSWRLNAVSITQLQTPQWIPQLIVVIGIVIFFLEATAQAIRNIFHAGQSFEQECDARH